MATDLLNTQPLSAKEMNLLQRLRTLQAQAADAARPDVEQRIAVAVALLEPKPGK